MASNAKTNDQSLQVAHCWKLEIDKQPLASTSSLVTENFC